MPQSSHLLYGHGSCCGFSQPPAGDMGASPPWSPSHPSQLQGAAYGVRLKFFLCNPPLPPTYGGLGSDQSKGSLGSLEGLGGGGGLGLEGWGRWRLRTKVIPRDRAAWAKGRQTGTVCRRVTSLTHRSKKGQAPQPVCHTEVWILSSGRGEPQRLLGSKVS